MDLRKQALPFWQCSNIGPWSVCTQTTFYVHQLVRENVSGECVDWQLNEASCGLKITSQIWFNGIDMRKDESRARKTCSVTTVWNRSTWNNGILSHHMGNIMVCPVVQGPILAQSSQRVKCNR